MGSDLWLRFEGVNASRNGEVFQWEQVVKLLLDKKTPADEMIHDVAKSDK